jgi:prophage DNA circulation protein
MAWTDRLNAAAYTSPGGTRQTFEYEDVRRSVEKKTTAFDFPDADGTYIQDLGNTGRQYPLRLFFWGPDYDLAAASFESLLLERGPGRLEHPAYGTVDVVPFGTITRRDDLKTAANQAVLEVTFWETIGIIYPTGQTDPGSSVLSAVDAYNAALSEQTAGALDLSAPSSLVSFKNTYDGLLSAAAGGLQAVADTQDGVRRQFDAINESINRGIDTLVSTPLDLVFQTTLLIQAPARSASAISARLSAYGDLASSLLSGDGAVVSGGDNTRDANTFYARDVFASSYVSGSVVSAVNARFETKAEAILAAEAILTQLSNVETWREANYAALAAIDTGGAYQKLQEAVALTAGFLVDISFSLKQERAVVLDRARTIVDLSAELYGSVDDQLDFLISSNSLTGSEILELPEGRRIVYYV